jgi:hypothetical protein
MKYLFKTILIAIILSATTIGHAQNAKRINRDLQKHMESKKQNEQSKLPDAYFGNRENQDILLEGLNQFYTDSSYNIRIESVRLANKIGQKSSDTLIRQKVVLQLLTMCNNPNTAIAGRATRYLTNYMPEDYNRQARDSLKTLINTATANYDIIVKLIGYLQLNDQINTLYAQLMRRTKFKDRWALHLALARLGVEREIDYCVNKVKSIEMNDDVVYEIVPDLIYTRQKKVFDYLIEEIMSDKKKCTTPNPELGTSKIKCGYRIMEYMAPVIKDFPLETHASGDIKTSDYKAALKTVRTWFNTRGDGYEIVKTGF